MPLLTTLQAYVVVNLASEAISVFVRMKQLNGRQVVRAQWLSFRHDTRLTSGVAPNQIKTQR